MAVPHKPKMAFYSLEDEDPISRGSSGTDSPKLRGRHRHGRDLQKLENGGSPEPGHRARQTPEALKKYPVVDDGVNKVRVIQSKALSRNSSTSSTQSEQMELQASEFRKNTTRCWGAFSNLGFLEAGEDDNDDIEQLFVGLANNVKQTEDCLEDWKALREQITINRASVTQEIEKRKKKMIKRIKDYAQVLHGRLDAMIDPRLENVDHIIDRMTQVLDESNQLSDGTFINAHKVHQDVKQSRDSLARLCTRLESGQQEAPKWQDVHLVKTENSHQLITNLFGDFQGGLAASGVLGDALVAEGQENQRKQSLIMDNIEFISSFNTKTSKDQRECGITDIAVTSANQIVVIDKHNKLVKLFDMKGKLEKYIGRGFLKEPNRVSVCRSNGHILVTDIALKSIQAFRRDGSYIGEFVSDLKYPISHCETSDGKVAVLEYATKTILLYDETGKTTHTFPTEMTNPAYMGCTRDGNIVVTDWKNNTFKSFDSTGAIVWSYSGQGADMDKMKLPHGVCGDGFGHVIIADKGNTRVQIFTEVGDHVACLKPTETKSMFKLPYAVDTNKCDLLVVAEYQGHVKIFKYLDLPFHGAGGHGEGGAQRLPEEVHVEEDSETVV